MDNRASSAITSIRVRTSDLASRGGILTEDVLSQSGAVLLPAGVDLTSLEKNIGQIITKLRKENVEWVMLKLRQEYTDEDIDKIVETVYSDEDALIDKEEAEKVVRQVDVLFKDVRENGVTPEMVTPLANMGEGLAVEVLKNPSVVFSLGKVQDTDEYTFVHSFNTALLTGFLAHRLYPNDDDYVKRAVVGGLMHDIGKAQIPVAILNKPGPLNMEEFEIMKKHPLLGLEMAMASGIHDDNILGIISSHHEKWSGKGYPKGLAEYNIPETARISAVADVFDALTAQRVYKKGMPPKNAMNIIMYDVAKHFDPKIARELLLSLGLYPPGSMVQLSNGSIGLVVSGGGADLVRPIISLQEGPKGEKYDAPEFIDLKNTDIYIVAYLGCYSKRAL